MLLASVLGAATFDGLSRRRRRHGAAQATVRVLAGGFTPACVIIAVFVGTAL